jgi:hypothetical protein
VELLLRQTTKSDARPRQSRSNVRAVLPMTAGAWDLAYWDHARPCYDPSRASWRANRRPKSRFPFSSSCTSPGTKIDSPWRALGW